LDGTIQDVRNGVKELQLLRAQLSFPFEMEIIQVITETQCVLYENSMLGEGALFGKYKYGVYKEYQIRNSKLAGHISKQVSFKQVAESP
jgi:hypothetical protein